MVHSYAILVVFLSTLGVWAADDGRSTRKDPCVGAFGGIYPVDLESALRKSYYEDPQEVNYSALADWLNENGREREIPELPLDRALALARNHAATFGYEPGYVLVAPSGAYSRRPPTVAFRGSEVGTLHGSTLEFRPYNSLFYLRDIGVPDAKADQVAEAILRSLKALPAATKIKPLNSGHTESTDENTLGLVWKAASVKAMRQHWENFVTTTYPDSFFHPRVAPFVRLESIEIRRPIQGSGWQITPVFTVDRSGKAQENRPPVRVFYERYELKEDGTYERRK